MTQGTATRTTGPLAPPGPTRVGPKQAVRAVVGLLFLALAPPAGLSCASQSPHDSTPPEEPTAQELHAMGTALLEGGDFAEALDAFRRAHAAAEPEARDAITFNVAVAAAKAGDCRSSAEAVQRLRESAAAAEWAESARQAAESEGCRVPAVQPSSTVATRGPPPPPPPRSTAGRASEEGIVAEPVVRKGDPFEQTGGGGEDFRYSCYLGSGRGVLAKRHVRVGKSRTVAVHERPGVEGPGKPVEVALGQVVAVKDEVVISIPSRAYRVTKSGTCSCPSELCMSERPKTARFEAGELVYPRATDAIGDTDLGPTEGCAFGDAEVQCEDNSWLSNEIAECFRRMVEPVQVRAPKGVVAGWWIRLEQGWVHADGEFELQVQCDGGCEARVDRCIDELRCRDAACEKKCADLHNDCTPSWQSAALSG